MRRAMAPLLRGLSLALLISMSTAAAAEPLRVAVASNFEPAMAMLAAEFEGLTGHRLAISYGATGKHYAQIVNGAPFAVFLAADSERPRRLEAEGHAVAGSRFTYALGQLVLWSPSPDLFTDGARHLESGEFRFLAIANPRTAPYGMAAEQALRALGLWDALQDRIVRGENIGQAFGYVESGNAQLGLVAASQVAGRSGPDRGTAWIVAAHLYSPIEQQAVLLEDQPAARALLDYLRGERAAAIIRDRGYGLP